MIVIDTSLIAESGSASSPPERANGLRPAQLAGSGRPRDRRRQRRPAAGIRGRPRPAARRARRGRSKAAMPPPTLFDSPEQNVQRDADRLGSCATPAYRLGNARLRQRQLSEEQSKGFIGQSGFLLSEVAESRHEVCAGHETRRYEVRASSSYPNVEELAVEARAGHACCAGVTVAALRGSCEAPALGQPRASTNQSRTTKPRPYIPIPDNCLGSRLRAGDRALNTNFKSSNTAIRRIRQAQHQLELNPNAVELRLRTASAISEEAEGGKGRTVLRAVTRRPPTNRST